MKQVMIVRRPTSALQCVVGWAPNMVGGGFGSLSIGFGLKTSYRPRVGGGLVWGAGTDTAAPALTLRTLALGSGLGYVWWAGVGLVRYYLLRR